MAVLSKDAQAALDRYLQRIRTSLRGHTSVDVDDVERDVQGHIHAAVAEEPEPIDAGSIRRVLEQLGAPEQWVPADDLPTWRRALATSRATGDWWLPYVAFICFLAGPLLFFIPVEGEHGAGAGPFLWPLPVVLMIASFVLARASLSVLSAAGESIETRRWLLYPPLLFWYLPALVALFAWPVALVLAANTDFPAVREWTARFLPASEATNRGVIASIALAGWWILLGLFVYRFKGALPAVFWPFAEWLERRHAISAMLAGAMLLAGAVLVIAVSR